MACFLRKCLALSQSAKGLAARSTTAETGISKTAMVIIQKDLLVPTMTEQGLNHKGLYLPMVAYIATPFSILHPKRLQGGGKWLSIS